MTEQMRPTPQRSGWAFAAVAALFTIIGWPLAGGLYSPHPIGVMPWMSVALFLAVAVVCAICFLLCPRRPFAPKLLTLVLTVFALFWAVDALAYRCLNYVDYH